jgi:hypothetical protein
LLEALFKRKKPSLTQIFIQMKISIKHFLTALFLFAFSSNQALACACGCGVFSVGTSAIIPNCEGGTAFLQYDHMTQSRNWSKKSQSNGHNHHQKIQTQTVTAGAQYMFSRDWGAAVRLPYVTRAINSSHHDDDDHLVAEKSRTNSIGDIRLNAIYSGFSDDMSGGLTFGLKLPTGQTNAQSVSERNMQIGTGSTDLLLGAYKMGKVSGTEKFNWFVQGNLQHALNMHRGFRVGDEISAAIGTYYNAGSFFGIKKVAPIAQISGARRSRDTGWASSSVDSGYSQAYFAPAIELSFEKFKLYADVEFPIYRNVNGNQLVPQNLYKMILGYNF